LETCDPENGCLAGELLDCNDGIECTVDSCDPIDGCSNVPDDALCDDGNPCTIDRCDPDLGCQYTDVVCASEFFIPMPESQLWTVMQTLEPGEITGSIETEISIKVGSCDTVVYYDHWEDGYEADISNPVQTSTGVWGDGDDTNGIAPGYSSDPAGLPQGVVFSLGNTVTLPRNPSVLVYDGRDYVSSEKSLRVTRATWPTRDPGPMLAGAAVVLPIDFYGTNYVSPIGQDVSANDMFQYVGLFVQAAEDGTAVTVDTNGSAPGGVLYISLNRGESYVVNGGILTGATVTATQPVQVDLITGDINANYEMRWYNLFSSDGWYNSYVTPVGTASNGQRAFVFVYNPGASSISIDYTTSTGAGSFTVGANSVVRWQVPQNSGGLLESAGGEPFYAIATIGSGTASNPANNQLYEWGFTLTPETLLTDQAIVSWAPGSIDLTENVNPVWVSALSDTTIQVDYNGNGTVDDTFAVTALQSLTIFDPDNDQTGMKLSSSDGTPIVVVWGQDPSLGDSGSLNQFDLGTTVLPFSECCFVPCPPCVGIEAYVYLEGAVIDSGGSPTYALPMRTDPNDLRILPGQAYDDPFLGVMYSPPGQPYSVAPWFYMGTEGNLYDSLGDPLNGDADYPPTVVDWVLVSLRETADGAGGPVCQAAALLHRDGSLEFEGGGLTCCGLDLDGEFYVVIEHYNHLLVMSHEPIPIINDKITYDFRIQQSYVNDPYGFGYYAQKEVSPGVYVMFGGNGKQEPALNDDTDIEFNDRGFWELENGIFRQYSFGDYNLNGDINFNDRLLWEINNGIFTSVPRD